MGQSKRELLLVQCKTGRVAARIDITELGEEDVERARAVLEGQVAPKEFRVEVREFSSSTDATSYAKPKPAHRGFGSSD